MRDETFLSIIFMVIIIIGILLLFREFWCWYWKINLRMRQMDLINDNLEQIKRLLIQGNAMTHKEINEKKEDKMPEI